MSTLEEAAALQEAPVLDIDPMTSKFCAIPMPTRKLRYTIGLTLGLDQTAQAHALLERGEVMGTAVLNTAVPA
jgi:hypothetical protein